MTSQEKDIRQLNLLGKLHYALGSLAILVTCFGLIVSISLGIMISKGATFGVATQDTINIETTVSEENIVHNDIEEDVASLNKSEPKDIVALLKLAFLPVSLPVGVMVILAFFILLWLGLIICLFISGRKLRQRKGRMFSMAIAVIECVMIFRVFTFAIPVQLFYALFVVLGIFTLITLNKNSIKELYKKNLCNL